MILETIDNEIKELQKLRKYVLKGGRKISKSNSDEIVNFEALLTAYDVPFTTFEFGNERFYKILENI